MQPSLYAFMLVACGGALGSIARYGVAIMALKIPMQLPIGTFAANILGCFLIGVFSRLSMNSGGISPGMRLFLIAGFCGGFTTFSTLVLDIITLVDANSPLQAIIYVSSSIGLGLLALLFGVWVVKVVL